MQVLIATGAKPQHCLHHDIPLYTAVSISAVLLLGTKILGVEAAILPLLQRGTEMLGSRTAGQLMGNSGL